MKFSTLALLWNILTIKLQSLASIWREFSKCLSWIFHQFGGFSRKMSPLTKICLKNTGIFFTSITVFSIELNTSFRYMVLDFLVWILFFHIKTNLEGNGVPHKGGPCPILFGSINPIHFYFWFLDVQTYICVLITDICIRFNKKVFSKIA